MRGALPVQRLHTYRAGSDATLSDYPKLITEMLLAYNEDQFP